MYLKFHNEIIGLPGEASGGKTENLLINGHFYEPARINQRNVSGTIADAGYFIDRWMLTEGAVTLTDAGLVLNGTIEQRLEYDYGADCVATALTTAGLLITGTYTNGLGGDYKAKVAFTGTGQTLVAAKLEMGNRQTLARQENYAWALNDPPPDYSLELLKCQRYFVNLNRRKVSYAIFGIAVENPYSGNLKRAFALLDLPATMRTVPAISRDGRMYTGTGGDVTNMGQVDNSAFTGNKVMVELTCTNNTEAGRATTFGAKGDANAYIWLDAEL